MTIEERARRLDYFLGIAQSYDEPLYEIILKMLKEQDAESCKRTKEACAEAATNLAGALREACQFRGVLCRNGDADDESGDPLKWDKPLQRWSAALATYAACMDAEVKP
jgi:hypothetical protein